MSKLIVDDVDSVAFPWRLLDTRNISSGVASIDFDIDQYSADYDSFLLEVRNLTVVTDAVSLYLNFSLDNASTWEGGSDCGALIKATGHSGGSPGFTGISTPFYCDLVSDTSLGNGSNEVSHGKAYIYNPFASGQKKYVHSQFVGSSSTSTVRMCRTDFHSETNDNWTDIRIEASSGNIDNCDIKLFGYKL